MIKFFITLWYRILCFVLPQWMRIEIYRSIYCNKHLGQRCDCLDQYILDNKNREFQLTSHFWFQKQTLEQKIELLEAEIFNAKSNAKCWHNAWYDQRDATGKTYWKGYSDGKQIAISFHTKEADKKLDSAKNKIGQDKLFLELDARYHSWSADQIKLQGYNSKKAR